MKKLFAAANWTQIFNCAYPKEKTNSRSYRHSMRFFCDYSYAIFYKIKTSKQTVYQRSFWSTLVVNDAHNHLCQGIRWFFADEYQTFLVSENLQGTILPDLCLTTDVDLLRTCAFCFDQIDLAWRSEACHRIPTTGQRLLQIEPAWKEEPWQRRKQSKVLSIKLTIAIIKQ